MDIYIVHQGQESGPYSEKAAAHLLAQGSVEESDLAWRQGLPDWQPLGQVLAAEPARPAAGKPKTAASAPSAEAKPASTPAAGDNEPATPKQKALLTFLHLSMPADLSRDHASRMINDAMENPQLAERLTLWNEERLRLHPELFAAEIQAKKENRAQHFLELCQTTGAEYFNEISKAHCQVLVSFLDVKFPNWSAREAEAAEHYFFPAVAEKFPQLVRKQWRGRLHYADGGKVSAEIIRGASSTSKLRRTSVSPMMAVVRGLLLGAFVLGVLYFGYWMTHENVVAAPAADGPPSSEVPAFASSNAPAAGDKPATSRTAAVPPPPAPTAPTPAPVPEPAAAPAPIASIDPVTRPASTVPLVAPPDAAPMAANPPGASATAAAGDPPVPLPPPAPTLPMAGGLPTAENSSVPPVPASPPETAPPLAPPIPDPPTTSIGTAKTNLVLTKPVDVPFTYGRITLPTGTAVRLVSRQGVLLKVSYRDSVFVIPASSTDFE